MPPLGSAAEAYDGFAPILDFALLPLVAGGSGADAGESVPAIFKVLREVSGCGEQVGKCSLVAAEEACGMELLASRGYVAGWQ